MGAKYSSVKCKPSTIDYIRSKNLNKLTRQLSKQKITFGKKKRLMEKEETQTNQLKLDADHDAEQRSALHFAAIDGDATIIVALYEYMHTVDVLDNSGRTPLHYAAIVGNEETLITLLLCNPDVNRISKDGTTPIHEAIIHNHPRILTLLLQNRGDANILFQDYLPTLTLAVYLNNRTLTELLIRSGVDPNLADTRFGRLPLHYAAFFHENADIFQLILSSTNHYRIDINAQDQAGLSVIDYARANIHGDTAIVNLLLQLNVYDPFRGEITRDNIQIETPKLQIFQSPSQLTTLSKSKKKSTTPITTEP